MKGGRGRTGDQPDKQPDKQPSNPSPPSPHEPVDRKRSPPSPNDDESDVYKILDRVLSQLIHERGTGTPERIASLERELSLVLARIDTAKASGKGDLMHLVQTFLKEG